MRRSKAHLAITLVLVAAALIGGPYALAAAGVMPSLRPLAWVVLGVVYVGIFLKAMIGYLVSREFRYDRTAHEMSVLVFGGVLTFMALQVVTDTVLFPGLQNISFLGFMSSFGVDLRGQHVALLFALLTVSLASTVTSAIGVAETESGKPCWWWTLVCSAVSYALLGAYALALIAKV